MTAILMSPPDYYGIEYSINPWMDKKRGADRQSSHNQWLNLYHILQKKLGLEIHLIDAVQGLPDLSFTANAGYVQDDLFIAANFRFDERKGEEKHFISWFEKRGYRILQADKETLFEGEGDLLPSGETLFAGHRYRSHIDSHSWVAEVLDRQVLSLELVDPRFYHLDTCFLPLTGGEVVYYPPAFDNYAREVIENHFAPSLRITVNEEEACRFACNAVIHENKIALNTGCPQLAKTLGERGYQIFETDLSEFIKAGGSAKCLTLWLRGKNTLSQHSPEKNEGD